MQRDQTTGLPVRKAPGFRDRRLHRAVRKVVLRARAQAMLTDDQAMTIAERQVLAVRRKR